MMKIEKAQVKFKNLKIGKINKKIILIMIF